MLVVTMNAAKATTYIFNDLATLARNFLSYVWRENMNNKTLLVYIGTTEDQPQNFMDA